MVHRAIKAVLQQKTYAPESWEKARVHTSFTERRADEASRDVENWLKRIICAIKWARCLMAKSRG